MPTDTQFGKITKHEDFLVTAVADLPEIDVQSVTGDTAAVVAGGADGRLRHTIATSNDDDNGSTSFGALNWKAGDGRIYMEARLFLSSVADIKVFVGFADSIATADETTFSATTDTVTIDTITDGIGILFDNDQTTKQWMAVAGATDAVTVSQFLGSKVFQSEGGTNHPAINTAFTLGVELSRDRKQARFYVNGKEVYAVNSATVLVGAVGLVPIVVGMEQGTAYNLDIDYIHAEKSRSDA